MEQILNTIFLLLLMTLFVVLGCRLAALNADRRVSLDPMAFARNTISGGNDTTAVNNSVPAKTNIELEPSINICLQNYFTRILYKQRKIHNDLDKKTIAVFHFADWCPYCIEMKAPWNTVKFKNLKNTKLILLEHDEEQCKTIGVNIVPVVFKITTENKIAKVCKYAGPKKAEDLEKWLLE
jgi:thiol-disulfide isomerase/thioredoxin